MDLLAVPFNKKIGLQKTTQGLTLNFEASNLNHLKTIHAGAQFALAESVSGEALQNYFPHLVEQVIPVLRHSEIKYKKPALSSIYATAHISSDSLDKFEQQFNKKGRAIINISVDINDTDNQLVATGIFSWFIQKRPQEPTS